MARVEQEPPTVRSCGTQEVHERLLRTAPGYANARALSENRAFDAARGAGAGGRNGVTVIPVVVHVVYNAAAQNIGDAQVQSEIAVLNRDFRRTNGDWTATPSVFQPLAADARVEFELATTDPNGNPTSGIERVHTTAASFADDDKVKSAATGGADAWDSGRYLNLWVCRLAGGLLGYAQFPGGPAATDGVVILDTAFGDTGTAAAPFGLGRTATHEIGHWLNLRHIWGDDGTGCNGDDFVADTPNAAGPNFGAPAFPHVTCSNGPNGDLFMNYMDYVDDAAMVMFTNGQVTRMQTSLDNDRPTIGHVKAGPTLSFVDLHPTVAAVDQITLARADQGPTVSIVDLIHTSPAADIIHTVAQIDLSPTVSVLDHIGTIARLDQGLTTLAGGDLPTPVDPLAPVVNPQLTANPQPLGNATPPIAPVVAPAAGAAPFALATPHHTDAWIASHTALRDQQAQQLAAQAQQLEAALGAAAQAEAAGTLSNTEAMAAEQLNAEYQRVMSELDALGVFKP